MKEVQIHSLEGEMLFYQEGCERLYEVVKSSVSSVLVISSDKDKFLDTKSLIESAKAHDEKVWIELENCEDSINTLIAKEFSDGRRAGLLDLVRRGFTNIEDILKAVWLVQDTSYGTIGYLDYLVGTWVVNIAQELLQKHNTKSKIVNYVDAINLTDIEEGAIILVNAPIHKNKISFDSEIGAARIAVNLNASSMTFWNNKSLLRTADISEVPSATVIEKLSFNEATELSYFGSDVINPKAIKIALNESIPVKIKCWKDFNNSGTEVVMDEDVKDDKQTVKGFSVIHNISLINIEGAGLSGQVGFSSTLFNCMKMQEISVILYSQASSEYSISIAVHTLQASVAIEAIEETFKDELESGIISSIQRFDDMAIIAAVGNKMAGRKGVAGTFFRSLGRAGINVKAIAQGSSERNLSAVINGNESRRALRALHAAFFLSRQALSVGLIGPGNIGGTLLDQIKTEKDRLKNKFDLDIRIRAIASSKKMLLSEDGVDLDNWQDLFEKEAVDCDLDLFAKHVGATYFPHRAIIDCTSSSYIASKYVDWLENMGCHVITPNKKAGTAEYCEYEKLFDTCLKTGRRFFYETTVGAGLPVIGTLKDLVQTGDNVRTIEGVVSGTLAWLFNNYDGKVPFSELVMNAKNMGYTEPDPRDDLSGMDVARKTVILARELGYKVEVSDLDIESLVPEELAKLPIDEFLRNLTQLDDAMLKRYNDAKNEDKRLCYVGKVDENGKCSVALTAYPMEHPFSQASGTDNVICFTTDRYLEQPLVIKGPGAGREVTAGGVFSDILRLSAYLGARL